MHVRIARFEGIDPQQIGQRLEDIRASVELVRSGGTPEGIPEESSRVLREDVTRVMTVVDRSGGVAIDLVFAESEEAIGRVHEALDRMSPPEGAGRRASWEICEVAFDEAMR